MDEKSFETLLAAPTTANACFRFQRGSGSRLRELLPSRVSQARQFLAFVTAIHHLLGLFEYNEIERPNVILPERIRHVDYSRNRVPPEIVVPEIY